MAKYTITHICGHTSTQQLFGKHSERDRKIEWWESVDCPECYKKAKDEAMVEKVAAEKKYTEDYLSANHLPDLTGSDKQIAWANSIRVGIIAEAEVMADALKKADQTNPDYLLVKKHFDFWLSNIKAQTSAKWWIDHRYQSTEQVMSGKDVGSLLNLTFSGSLPKTTVISLFDEYLSKQSEVIEYREKLKKEEEDKVAEYEARKQAHIESTLSCLDNIDWERVIEKDPAEVISSDGHKIELHLINGDRVAVAKIDGNTSIEFDGKFAGWISYHPKTKELSDRLTEMYVSKKLNALQNFIPGDREDTITKDFSDPEYQFYTIKSRDGRIARVVLWDGYEYEVVEVNGKSLPDAVRKSEHATRIINHLKNNIEK